MNCSICHRAHHAQKLPFLCAVDGRNQLYEPRLENVRALIENEAVKRQVNELLAKTTDGSGTDSDSARLSRARLDRLRSEQAASEGRTNEIIAQAERLRADVEAARKEIEAKKKALARRKSDFEAVAKGTESRRTRQLDETEKSIQRVKYKWNRSAETMAATRAFLCEEAARLYGLRQIKKGNTKRYEIGGVEIVELHNMHNVAPEVISTSLAHIAHILVLASHYLAVRLPAEITLPHRDYPKPTIFTLASSYKNTEVPFPGLVLPLQTSSGPRDTNPLPHPRPLFIDKSLPTLAKDDPAAYPYFLEGVSHLAYNIAWLCCSQGVSFGDKNSYEDMCNIGQNLWKLLIGDQIYRTSVEPAFPSSLPSPSGTPNELDTGDLTKAKSRIGRWSHGTTHTFLGGADGSQLVHNFKILTPTKLVDRLKKRLSNEAPMLGWEKIDDDEFRGAGGDLEDGVFVQDRRKKTDREHVGMESVMSVRPPVGFDVGFSASPKGTNGWTKLKGR